MNDRRTAEEIFHAARERSEPPERAGFLDGACGGDSSLRAEVDALLAADAEAGSFLAPAEQADPDATVPKSAQSGSMPRGTEQAGQIIGRYKLLQQIGEGGFGSVWMAEQREPVKRRVALKIIKLGMDTRQVIARFEAERQALALMDHPNIAKVLDAGSTETGRPYFVMEYIKGVPILEYCDTEKLDTPARLDLFMKVCHAIQHAHQKGIIHRDIKPTNVLVTLHDGAPVPKVIDFGIAKATSAELTTRTLFTEHRQMIGTPAYMSPEQAEMSGLDIDTRSDIYSLGVLLYELLTGTTPFDTKALVSQGFAEMMRIIREVEPHKPSTRLSSLGQTGTRTAQQRRASDAKRLSQTLRGDLDWIVMKCLEKDRTRRYETANGLAADIRRHLNNEPVAAGPPSTIYSFRKFVKRNRGRVVVGCVLSVALLAAFVSASWGLVEANRAQSIRLQHELDTQRRDAADSARIARNAEAVSTLLGQSEDALRAGDTAKATVTLEAARKRSAEGGAEKDAERLARLTADLDLSVDLDAVDRIRWTWTNHGEMEALVAAIKRNQDALQKFGIDPGVVSVDTAVVAVKASAVRERIVAALDRLLWATHSQEVMKETHELLRRLDSDPFRNAVRDALRERDDESEAKLAACKATMIELADRPAALEQPAAFAAFLGDFKSIDSDRRVEVLQAAVLRRPRDLGVLIGLIRCASDSQRSDSNEILRWGQAGVAAAPTYAGAYINLGVSLKVKGRLDEAIACYRRAIELDPTFAMAYMNLANVLAETGHFEEALVNHRKAIELDPMDFEGYCTLGNTLSKHGRLDEAIDALRKAIELNPRHAEAHYALGVTLQLKGQMAEAIDSFAMAIEANPRSSESYCNLGATLRKLGRLDEALACFKKAIELNPKYTAAMSNLGCVLSEQGRHDEAIVACKNAIESDPKFAMAYFNLGSTYAAVGAFDDAVATFRKAIEYDPDYAESHCNMAQALQNQGNYEEALTEYKRCHELGSRSPDWKYPSGEWVRTAEAKVAMAAKLPALRKGEFQPADNAERAEFAFICQGKKRNYAAVGLFSAVLSADPAVGENVEGCVRYNAACVALLSAAGQGEDAANLADDERVRLRKQALDWLRADLNVATKRLESANPPIDAWSRWFCTHLQRNPDLVSVRDPAALSQLPDEERTAFTKFWDDAAALLKKAEIPIPKPAGAETPPVAKDSSHRDPGEEHTLADIDQLGVALRQKGKLAEAEPYLRESLEKRRRVLGDEHPETLTYLTYLGLLLQEQNKHAESEPYLREAMEMRRRVLGENDPLTIQSIFNMGLVMQGRGKPAEAEQYFREALDRKGRRVEEEQDVYVLKCFEGLGAVLLAQGNHAEAEQALAEGLRECQRAFAAPQPTTALLLHHHAEALRRAGRLDEALTEAQRAHQMYGEHPDWSPNEAAHAAKVLAAILTAQGHPDEALAVQREVLAFQQRTLPAGSDKDVDAIINLGQALMERGKYAEAEPYVRAAMEKRRRVLGAEDPSTLSAVSQMGSVLEAQDKFAEAEPYVREALDTSRRVLGEKHLRTLEYMNNMGNLLLSERKLGQAEPYLRDALEGRRHSLGEEHAATLISMNNMAGLLADLGKAAEAEPLYREVLEKCRRVQGADHPDTLRALNNLGNFLWNQGRLAQAEPYLREALEKHRRVLGESHPYTLTIFNDLGMVLVSQGKLTDGERVLAEGVGACDRAFTSPREITALHLHHHADALRALGRLDDAAAEARRALDMYRDHPDWASNEAAHATSVLASILTDQARPDETVAVRRELLAAQRRHLTPGSSELGNLLAAFGLELLKRGTREAAREAEPLLRECLEIRLKTIPDDWRVPNTRSLLGGVTLLVVELDSSLTPASRADLLREAERLLLEGYQGMKERDAAIPPQGKVRIPEALERVVRLYEVWDKIEPGKGHDAKAAEWRRSLEASAVPRPTEDKQ